MRPDPPPLGRYEVHLWWARSDDGEPQTSGGWLSDAEARRAERFRSERDRRHFRFRRCFLRALLASYLGRDPSALALEEGRHGKPRLRAPGGGDLEFNLSRSGEWILIAVARGRVVGVDVERLAHEAELSSMAAQVFARHEVEAFEKLPPGERMEAFFRTWTRKEAVLKALGEGLHREPRTLTVGLAHHPPNDVWAPDDPFLANFGALADLEAPVGFAAAVAAAGADWRPRACVAPPR